MKTLFRILGYLYSRKSLVIGTLVAQLGQISFALLTPSLIKVAIDRGIIGRDLDYLLTIAILIVFVAILRGFLWQHVIYGYNLFAANTALYLRGQMFEKIQRSALSYHGGMRSGDLFSNGTIDLSAIEEFLQAGIRELFYLIVFSSFALVLLLQIDPTLTLIGAPTFLAVAALAIFYGPRARGRYRQIQMDYGRTTSALQENLNGVRVVKAFAREDDEIGRFKTQINKLFDSNMRVALLNSFVWPTMTLATTFGVAAVIYFGGQRVIAQELSLGSLVAFISYLMMLVGPVRGLGMTINLITGAIAGAERIHALLDHRQVVQTPEEGAKLPDLPLLRGAIEFENVTFSYSASGYSASGFHSPTDASSAPVAGETALSNVSFSVEPGETLGIVGLTGSGKSTLALLIDRYYDPRKGRVSIDGFDLRNVNLASLRSQVGIVFQEAFLFSATIAENIALGNPSASQDEIEDAARVACLHDYVATLDDGYKTMLGERGITLSGGQRQRLALARALLTKPQILVLDDTTSSVDPVTEREIWTRIRQSRKDITTVIIAQRVASVRTANQIIVLDRGHVVESGSHDELMSRGGLYSTLATQQASQSQDIIDHDILLDVDETKPTSANGASAGKNGKPYPPKAVPTLAASVATQPADGAANSTSRTTKAPEGSGKIDVLSLNPADDMLLGKAYDGELMSRMLVFIQPFKRLIVFCVFTMMVMSIASLASPYVQKLAIDGPITTGKNDELLLFTLVFIGVGIGQWFFGIFYHYALHRSAQEVLRALRLHVFTHLQDLSLGFYDRYKVGRLMSIMTGDIQAISNLLGSGLIQVVADFFVLIGVIVALLSLDPRLSLYTFSVVPAIATATIVLRYFARQNFRDVRRASSILNGSFAESIAGVRVTQAYCRESKNRDAFNVLNTTLRLNTLKAQFVMSVFGPTMDFLGSVSSALILGYGGFLVMNYEVSIGVLVAFMGYSTRFFEPIRDLTVRYNALQSAMAASERIFALLDTPPAVTNAPAAKELQSVEGAIRLENVTFGYLPERTILYDLNLDIAPGEQIAIVGPTGAGKTSIISLVCRFYDVSEGRITIDNIDLRDVTMESLRRQVAVVLQEPFLFSGTIADNLRFARPEATQANMEAACRAVGIHDYVASLPLSYNTEIIERGTNLSAGQRQLLSFARALLADPRVLILDEATSSVDTVTEEKVQQALRALLRGRTAIIIAHRLSTVRSSSRIVVVEAGRIVEVGSHAELMAKDGHYARLHQAAAFRPEPTAAAG